MKFSIGIRSLSLQLGSLLLTSVALSVIAAVFQVSYSFLFLLFSHACLAAFSAYLLKFDWWWMPIQFFFPLLAYLLSRFEITPYLYLVVLIIFSALFWSTYRTQVPYYPSRSQLLKPVLRVIEGIDRVKFVDIGSGMGGLLIDLANHNASGRFTGIEIAPLPWLVSVIRGFLRRSSVRFQFGDFYRKNFAEFDVVFCYLSPAAMDLVWNKLRAEMRPGSLFLSYEFIVPSVTPDISIQIENRGEYLYGWRI